MSRPSSRSGLSRWHHNSSKLQTRIRSVNGRSKRRSSHYSTRYVVYHTFLAVPSLKHRFQYEKPDEWRLSKVKRSARSVCRSLFPADVTKLTVSYRVKRLGEDGFTGSALCRSFVVPCLSRNVLFKYLGINCCAPIGTFW